MKIRIERGSNKFEEIKNFLAINFPDYEVFVRNNGRIVVKKNFVTGCFIKIYRRSIKINGNFPDLKLQILFYSGVILMGVVYPLLIYFLYFYRRFRNFEEEVGKKLRKEYEIE
jgi:hypothetical protein